MHNMQFMNPDVAEQGVGHPTSISWKHTMYLCFVCSSYSVNFNINEKIIYCGIINISPQVSLPALLAILPMKNNNKYSILQVLYGN